MNRRNYFRRSLMILGALLALATGTGSVRAQGSAGAGKGGDPLTGATSTGPMAARGEVAAQPSASIVATVGDFAWLTGTWRGTWGPRVAEQVWMAPQAGVMTGAFSVMETDKVLVIELFTLVQTPNGVELYIRHFTPELAVWEKGDPTKLLLASFDQQRFEFDNPVDGRPKKSILTRMDPDTVISRAEIVPETGEPQVIEITYHRVPPPAATVDKSAAKKKKP